MSAAAQPTPRASVLELITALAAGAAVLIVLSVPQMVDAFQHHPLAVASFFVFAVALQLMSANLYGRGNERTTTPYRATQQIPVGPEKFERAATVAIWGPWKAGPL